MALVIARFDVCVVRLDPAEGREIRKTRPCLVISPDEMNRHLGTAIIAPMTTKIRGIPTRISVHFQGKGGEVALDQLRTVDKSRLVRRLGRLDRAASDRVLSVLGEMFAP